jgi:hypothetical protein
VAVAFALAAQLAGQREPDLGLGGFDLGSSQVLFDVEVERPSDALMSSYKLSDSINAV